MNKTVPLIAFAGVLLSHQASAELLGFALGRSTNVANYSDLSVEGAAQVGDLDTLGARATCRLNERAALYGDLGIADFDYADDGIAFGGGLIYAIPGLLPDLDTALTGSFHYAAADDIDWNNIALRGVVSGEVPTRDVTLTWYGTVGLDVISWDADIDCNGYGCGDDSDTEVALGGGVILPVGPGEAYGGLEYIDDMLLAVGYRVGLQ